MADTQQTSEENFVIQTPSEVATTEAGAHTLAGAGAGVELSAADAYGFAGESKSQARLVLNRFFHQRLAIIGLCTFAALGIASVLVGHFWQFSYTDITNNLNSPPSATNPFGTNAIGDRRGKRHYYRVRHAHHRAISGQNRCNSGNRFGQWDGGHTAGAATQRAHAGDRYHNE